MLFRSPFNSKVTLSFNIEKEQNIKLVVTDLMGREVKTVMGDVTPSGKYSYNVDLSNLADGMYLAVLKKEEEIDVKKVLKSNN